MKILTMTALLAAQLATVQPAMAAELATNGEQRMGAFGGVRVRLPLGGNAREQRLRAGLTVAPALHGRLASGETRLRIGEGLELGLRGREPLRLSLAGRDVRRLGAQETGDDDGIPTGAWIAGGIVLIALGAVVAAALVLEDAGDDN